MSSRIQVRAALAGIVLAFAAPLHAGEVGRIVGTLVDQDDQSMQVGRAVVFLCDADTGLPLVATTKKPLATERQQFEEGIHDLCHAVTDDRGNFEFDDVPIGKYRLVAQSWSGTTGLPDVLKGNPSSIVLLHGVAEGVEVKSDEVVRAYPRQLGDRMLKIVCDPEEAHNFLLISRKPTVGDAILGPYGWGPDFITGLIGVTRMEQPHVTIIGLPHDQEIHVGLLNYDNRPGVGAASYRVGERPVVRLPILAAWSNGKHDPPERLRKLVEHIERQRLTVSALLGKQGSDAENREEIVRLLREQPDRMIKVDGVGEFRFADVLAALRYRDLRKFHRAYQGRTNQSEIEEGDSQ